MDWNCCVRTRTVFCTGGQQLKCQKKWWNDGTATRNWATHTHTHSIEKKRARNGKKLTEKKTKIWKKENGSGWTRTRHYQWIITQPNRFQSWMTRNFFIFEKTCNCIQCTHTHTWYVCCFTIRPPPRAHQCRIFQHLSMWFIHAFHDTTRFRAHETNCVLCTVHPPPPRMYRESMKCKIASPTALAKEPGLNYSHR